MAGRMRSGGIPASSAPSDAGAGLVVKPPFLFDTVSQVVAVDISITGRVPERSTGLVLLCFGGHPAPECLLDVAGRGRDHEVVAVIDPTLASHWRFVNRLRHTIRTDKHLRIIPVEKDAGRRPGSICG